MGKVLQVWVIHTKWKLFDCWRSFWDYGTQEALSYRVWENGGEAWSGPHLKGTYRVWGGKFEIIVLL